MIILKDIFIKYGDRILFNQISLKIGLRERIALVGKNGAGKSTLLTIIAGESKPDGGTIQYDAKPTIGYLHQDIEFEDQNTVLEEASKGLKTVIEIEKRLHEIEHEFQSADDETSIKLSLELNEVLEQFQIHGGEGAKSEVVKVLKGFGFKDEEFDKPLGNFSGGWKMRVEMAKLLLAQPQYLLLDEPTNYLDIESIIWLENYLKNYQGSIILISHDRRFLDKVTNRTLEIVKGKTYDYPVGYTEFKVRKKERQEMQSAAAKNQQKVIAQKERTIERFMAKESKTKMAQSMKKQLDKIDRIDIEEDDHTALRIKFLQAPRLPREVVAVQNLSKSYGVKNVLDHIDLTLERNEKVAFVGQNGQGKTTLAKILADELSYESGSRKVGDQVKLAYYAQDQTDSLDRNQTVLEAIEEDCPAEMRTKVRAILGAFLFSGEDADKKVSVLSGGEKSRLALAKMLLHPTNLLILDEPTNHLDMQSKDILKEALLKFDNSLIVVSHDREFLSGLTTKTIEFRDKKLIEYLGDINYFLEKREIDHLKDAERKTTATPAISQRAQPQPDRNEIKQLKRQIQYLERDIENLERDLKSFEVKMSDPEFFNSNNSQKTIDLYNKAKKDLKHKMEKWEKLAERMG